jgi:diguanylate cyclase (GGDEF)-like protein
VFPTGLTEFPSLACALAAAPDVAAACAAAARAVRDAGHPLTTLYLEQSGRLRCYAVHGYGQLYDGILPGVGVIGRAFADDRVTEACAHHSDYWEAAAGVEQELAVPVRVDGRCVGVLNVESRTPLPPSSRPLVESAAAALGRRLSELGGPPPESPSQQLVRYATSMAAASDLPALADVLLEAATDASGLARAVLLVGSPPRAVARRGLDSGQLAALTTDSTLAIVGWVRSGGSSRTSGEAAPAAPLQQALARAGMTTFVLVPLVAGSERLGILVVGDGARQVVPPLVVESLELLGALAAADVRSLRATQQLRRQARTDDLTGLPHRRSFTEALRAALALHEPGHCVAVVLLDLDGFKQVNDTHGHPAGDELLRRSAAALSRALRAGSVLYRLGGDEFGAVLLLERPEALAGICERLLEAVRALGATVSVGAVVVAGGEDDAAVVAAADAQLYAAKRAGRDTARLRP